MPITLLRSLLSAVLICFLVLTAGTVIEAQTLVGLQTGVAAAHKASAPYTSPFGMYGGLYLEKEISSSTGFRTEASVLMMRSKYTVTTAAKTREQHTLMQYSLRVPVMLAVETLPHIWLVAGPQFQYAISDLPSQSVIENEASATIIPPFTIGAAAGIIARTGEGVEVNLRASYGPGWGGYVPTDIKERLTYSAGIGIPLLSGNRKAEQKSRSKFTGDSYQLPGE